ncbi:MAG: hypothetical protein JNM67_09860, partial [Bacteroidetes bacterium]|nr:hypothetical protein [Bacteroidota bacterium]
ISNRSWSDASREYRFGFNTQEKDNEVAGKGNSYTAEFWQYDGRLGRRFNIDVALKPHISVYSSLSNTPISNVDYNGALDYYNRKGKWIGTDGNDDNRKGIVNSWNAKRIIKRNTRKSEFTKLEGVVKNNVVILPDVSTKLAINNSLRNTRRNTGRYPESDAEMHEEGGFSDNNGPHEALPGKMPSYDKDLIEGAGAQIDMLNAKDGTIPIIANIEFIWHTHPNMSDTKSEIPSLIYKNGRIFGDIDMAIRYPNATHIFISSVSERVFFYNSEGIYLCLKLSLFNEIIDGSSFHCATLKFLFEQKRLRKNAKVLRSAVKI